MESFASMDSLSTSTASVQPRGYAVLPGLASPADIAALREECEELLVAEPERAGVRDVLRRIPAVAAWARSDTVRNVVEGVLGPGAFVARSLLFDKTPQANWNVVWHQDTTIAVSERIDVAGYGPWSTKHATHHVQPPARVLEGMMAIRLHLDPCPENNGALLVVPGSHLRGVLSEREIDPAACSRSCVTLACNTGDAILMRPLLLHASRKSLAPSRRRVLHLEFAAKELEHGLDGGLAWAKV